MATDDVLAHFKLCAGGSWPSHIWTPTIGEELVCRREVGNIYDLVHAVAILRALLMNQKNLIAIMQHFISVTS